MKTLKNGPNIDKLKYLFKYNPNTGLFIRKINIGRFKAETVAGTLTKNKTYVAIFIEGKHYYAHRLAWLYMTGEWPKNLIDHKDLNGKNNKWENLREATNSQNLRNRFTSSNNTSGHKGITKSKKTGVYLVRITIGSYKTLEEAIKVYQAACKFYHGEFARIENA